MDRDQIKQKYLEQIERTKLVLHIIGNDLQNDIKDSVLLSVDGSFCRLNEKTNSYSYLYSTEQLASNDLNHHVTALSDSYIELKDEITRMIDMGNEISVSFFGYSRILENIIEPSTSMFLGSINAPLFIYHCNKKLRS